jgi:hypothetical protein
MSIRGQQIWTKVLTNNSITFNPEMGVTSVSIVLISGAGFFQGSLFVPDYVSTAVPLVVGSPVTISSDSGLPLDGLIIDCSSGGVINLIARQ